MHTRDVVGRVEDGLGQARGSGLSLGEGRVVAASDVVVLADWQVLGELVGDKNLEKFRIEYEKLHR